MAAVCVLGLVEADCYHDRDWKVALVNKKTYWAEVSSAGVARPLVFDYCLDQEAQSCIPCSSIVANKVMFPNAILPCTITTGNGAQSVNKSSILPIHYRVGTDKTTIYLNPPQIVQTIQCA